MGGLLTGIGDGLAQALEGLNPVKIAEQLAQVLQWVCHPNLKVFRPLVDLLQGLLQLTFHDLDKKALPAAKRGELMGQLLAAIVIMVLAKKVSPSLNLQGDKIRRAVLSAGQKAKVATKELPAVKKVDAAITGLKAQVGEGLSHKSTKGVQKVGRSKPVLLSHD
jgi:hypothetical protein